MEGGHVSSSSLDILLSFLSGKDDGPEDLVFAILQGIQVPGDICLHLGSRTPETRFVHQVEVVPKDCHYQLSCPLLDIVYGKVDITNTGEPIIEGQGQLIDLFPGYLQLLPIGNLQLCSSDPGSIHL